MKALFRCAIAMLAMVSALTFGILVAPTASADYFDVGGSVPHAPPGEGMGWAYITTEPGNIVKVHIVGRTDAVGSVGRHAGGCTAGYGWDDSTDFFAQHQFVRLDETGSGVATFNMNGANGPDFSFAGFCGSWRSLSGGPTDLFEPHPWHCRKVKLYRNSDELGEYCSSDGYAVVLDGGAPIGPPPGIPSPEQLRQQQNPVGPNCADQLSADLNKLPPGTEAALEQIKAVPKNTSTYGLATCALAEAATSDNLATDQDAFNAVCKTLESALDPLGIGAAKDFFCGTPVG